MRRRRAVGVVLEQLVEGVRAWTSVSGSAGPVRIGVPGPPQPRRRRRVLRWSRPGSCWQRAAEQLAAAGVPTPEVDAELLLAHVTGRPRALLRMAGGTSPPEQSAAFARLVAQRVQRIPLQHLTGLAPFRHLELRVGPATVQRVDLAA